MTAQDYINGLPKDRAEIIQSIRELIFELFPNIKENMDYRMPTYLYKWETLCAIASQKDHLVLYIMPYDLLDEFGEELKAYDMGKSCIRFRKLQPNSLDLFKRILTHCAEHYPQSRFYGRMNSKK